MLPFPNDFKYFQTCVTFDPDEIGQNVGLHFPILQADQTIVKSAKK